MIKTFLIPILSVFFIIIQTPIVYSQPLKNGTDCAEVSAEILSRKETLIKMNSSLDALLGNGEVLDIPLTVLFQVDLKDSEKIKQRKSELTELVKPEKIAALDDIKKYEACTQASDAKLIEDIVDLQIKFYEKKIKFFNIEPEQRDSLISAYIARREKIKGQEDLEDQLTKSKNALETARAALFESEEKSANEDKTVLESILVARSSIEKTLIDLESEHILFIEKLREKKNKLDVLQNHLADFSKGFNEASERPISVKYKAVNAIWEQSADGLSELFSNIELQSNLELPSLLILKPEENEVKIVYGKYIKTFDNVKNRQLNLSEKRGSLLNDLKAHNFRLLRDAGNVRAQFLAECDEVHCDRPRGLKEKNLRSIIREIRVMPLRLVAAGLSKWLELKSKMTIGMDGWIDIGKQLFFLLCFFSIPFFLLRSLRWTATRLDEYRKMLLSRSILDYRKRTSLALWIARINPFLTLVGMILSLIVAGSFIENTDLKELGVFVFYLEVYYIYRVFRLLLKMGLEISFSTGSVEVNKMQKIKIEKFAAKISGLIFLEYLLLHVTRDAVRKALAYSVFSSFIFYLNIILVFVESEKWREEICASFSFRFPSTWEKLERFINSRAGTLFYPVLFVLVVLNDAVKFVMAYLSKFDFFKRLLSEVLRKRLERSEMVVKDKTPPPETYLNSFDYYLSARDDIFVAREESLTQEANIYIDSWLTNKSNDDLIIIVGNRGMGKTTTIDQIHRKLLPKTSSIHHKVPLRLTSNEEFFAWLTKIFDTEIKNINDFVAFDKSRTEKLVLCIDDIQNLFLGVIGGFKVYKKFLEVASLKTSNIFWCLTVNSHSWAYLKGILGAEHFYGKILTISPWHDFEIQKLILARHESTKFEITFDESIKAYGAGDGLGSQVQSQFFRLLWGQSRGNPRSALMYWVSAITAPSENHIHVGVPSFVNSALVASMSDQALFLLAAIARHESLTHEELARVTNIENTVIRKCLKEAQDKHLIWIDEVERVRISSKSQYVIDYFLIGKNFLYE
jgi:hypothetical protein